jgi:hypothetical protein
MPEGGNCEDDKTFKIGSNWLKSKKPLDKVCGYEGNGKYYYDNGAACSKLLCDQSNGHWMDISDVEFNSNLYVSDDDFSNYLVSSEEKLSGQIVYDLNNTFTIDQDSKNTCDGTTSIIDKNNYIYTLVSNKPSDWYCPKFKKWDECSKDACIKNCENSTGYSNCELLCEPVNLNDPNLEVQASTTDFGFGAATSCMCNGKGIMDDLVNSTGEPFKTDEGYWVGVASPSWIQSPFNVNTYSGLATGGSTIASEYGQEYTSNCSIGNGGCGTCWELTRNDGKLGKINAVVIDTCEDKNAYGNNYNWCVAQRPDVYDFKPNPGGTYAGNWPDFYAELPLTSTNTSNADGNMVWKADADSCTDSSGNFICKNMDFYPTHFDVATQQIPNNIVDKIGMWHESTNPKVTAKRIPCPKKLKEEILTKHCGSNAKSSALPSEYCKGHGKKMCFSDDNLDGLWPASDCETPPSGPSGPPGSGPKPKPSRITGSGCYYNNCINSKDCDTKYSSPEDYCRNCSQKVGPASAAPGEFPNFTSTNWSDVDWGTYNTIGSWYEDAKQKTVFCKINTS